MYFIDERKSYDVPVLECRQISVRKETITEEFDPKEFIPLEYLDSDEELESFALGPEDQ